MREGEDAVADGLADAAVLAGTVELPIMASRKGGTYGAGDDDDQGFGHGCVMW